MRRWSKTGWRGAIVLGASSCASDDFVCTADETCVAEQTRGTCERDGHCAFPAPACATGRRYAALSGDVSEACVPAWTATLSIAGGTGATKIVSTGRGLAVATDFTSARLDDTSYAAHGSSDVLLVVLSAVTGRTLEAHAFGGPGTETLRGMVGFDDDAIVLGSFDASFSFGPQPLDKRWCGACGFLARVGRSSWTRQVPLSSTDTPDVDVAHLAQGPTRELLLTGSLRGQAAFGNSMSAASTPGSGEAEAFLAAYTADGIPTMATMIGDDGDPFYAYPRCSRVIGGTDLGALCLDARLGREVLVSVGVGRTVWDPGAATVRATTTDAAGTWVIAGSFSGELLAPDGTTHPAKGSRDVFVVRLRADALPGLPMSSQLVTVGEEGVALDVADVVVRSDDTLALAGTVAGAGTSFRAAGGTDAVVLEIGAHDAVASTTFGGEADDEATSLTERDGALVVVGRVRGQAEIHGALVEPIDGETVTFVTTLDRRRDQ